MDEFPESCAVFLWAHAAGSATHEYLTSSSREDAEGRLTLSQHAPGFQQRFLLTKLASGAAVTLQDWCGRYVGPSEEGAAAAGAWVARRYRTAPAKGWEELSAAVASLRGEDGLIATLALASPFGQPLLAQHQQGCAAWGIVLAAPPVLGLRGLQAEGGLAALAAAAPEASALGPAAQALVRQVLRAQRDVGGFFVVGHGLCRDLMTACQMAAGHFSWRPSEHAEGAQGRDEAFKLNLALVTDQRDRAPPARRHYSQGHDLERKGGAGLTPGQWAALALEYFDACKALSDGLLHLLALAAQSVDGVPRAWRGAWDDTQRFCALRVLVYDPGPVGDVITARHTDATWVTVLYQDTVGGLQLLAPWRSGEEAGQVWLEGAAPVAGALLVNTGNVLQEPLFHAACHRVVRAEGCATRLSLPFFYDRNGGATGGC